MEKYCISIDWLQVCCYSPSVDTIQTRLADGFKQGYEFAGNAAEFSTRAFKKCYNLFYRHKGEYKPFGTLLAEPVSTVINRNIVILKITNRLLYSEGVISQLYKFTNYLGLKIKGLTRLDIAYDCNYMHNHRNVQRFLRAFAFEPYTSKKFIYKYGSKKYRLFCNKSASSENTVTGIEFGSSSSSMRSYIYNKTQELKDVKDKPYIRETWQKNGLISTDDTPVYRFEISIRAEGMDLLNMSTGQLFRLSPHYLTYQRDVEKLFYYYADRLFRFHVKGEETQLRKYKRLQLFECATEVTCKPKRVNIYADTGKAEKMASNTLQRVLLNYTDISDSFQSEVRSVCRFLNEVSMYKIQMPKISERIKYLERFGAKESFQSLRNSYLTYMEIVSSVNYDFKCAAERANCEPVAIPIQNVDDSYFEYLQYLEWCELHKEEMKSMLTPKL